ncbi:hypothetical protein N7478_001703 [Penicillium angulare]|uniref:uncharacterized protein n=1 Tax=Penicillium angulare TaxID=116970 RepID=UPI0025422F15|nr:uncharacterized protein N7478_001703 [Penicillium angulare]KAJ5288673.1 hypothetical protein N7478_001703 [Penicillium angulare]
MIVSKVVRTVPMYRYIAQRSTSSKICLIPGIGTRLEKVATATYDGGDNSTAGGIAAAGASMPLVPPRDAMAEWASTSP